MNKRQQRVLIIMACLAIFFSSAAFVLPVLLTRPDRVYSMSNWSYEDVLGVWITRGGETFGFVRGEQDAWKLEGDPEFDVDRDRVVALVNNCRYLSVRETFEQDETAQWGLDQPAYSIEVKLVDGTVRVFDVGNKTVDNAGRFARERGNRTAFIIQAFADKIFSLDRNGFYNRKPDQVDWNNLLELKMTVANRFSMEITRLESGSLNSPLVMREPYVCYLNTGALEEFGKRLSRLIFTEYLGEAEGSELGQYGLASPAFAITAQSMGEALGIVLGDIRDGKVFAMRLEAPQSVYAVAYEDVEWMLNQAMPPFPSMYMFYGDAGYAVREYDDMQVTLEMAEGDRIFRVAPEGEGFRFTLNGVDFPEERAQQIVRALIGLKVAPPGDQSRGERLFAIEAFMNGLLVTKCVFYEYDDFCYAVDQGFGVALTTPKKQVDELVTLFY